MKKDTISDERILLQRRKIQSDAYQILVYFLLASVLIQQFLLKAPFSQFSAEFFGVVGIGVYLTIRYLTDGIDIWGSEKNTRKKILITSVISAAICASLLAFLSGEKNILILILFFLSFSAASFLIRLMIQYLNRKRQKQIESELGAEDTTE